MVGHDTHNIRGTFAVRQFRRLLAVRLTSQFSDGMFQTALAGSVLFNPDRQSTPMAIAAAAAVLILPYSLLGPYVGVLLDRWSRRGVIIWTNVARPLLVLPAAGMIHLAYEGLGFVTIVLVIMGFSRLLLAGLSAAVPHVVADRRLVTANALSGTFGSIAASLGLGCALLLLQTVLSAGDGGYAAVAALTPIGYLVSALLAWRSFTADGLGPDHVTRRALGVLPALAEAGRGMVNGMRHLVAQRGAAFAMAAQAAFRVLFGVLTMSMILLYRNYFTDGDDIQQSFSALAMVFAAGAAGVLTGALLTPPVARRIGGWRWITCLLAGVAVVLPVFGLPFSARLLVGAVFFLNVAAQGIKIVVDTSLQHECDDAFRGRVFSVNDTTFNLAYVLGLFAAALTMPDDGHSPTALVVVSVGFALIAAAYAAVAGRWARQAGDDIAQDRGARAADLSAAGTG